MDQTLKGIGTSNLYIQHSNMEHYQQWGQKTICLSLETTSFLIGVFYPDHISNSALYHCSQAEPISAIAQCARWQLFGHILKLPASAPANKAMMAYYSKPGVGKRGRLRTTLPIVLNKDLCINAKIKISADFEALVKLAKGHELAQSIVLMAKHKT